MSVDQAGTVWQEACGAWQALAEARAVQVEALKEELRLARALGGSGVPRETSIPVEESAPVRRAIGKMAGGRMDLRAGLVEYARERAMDGAKPDEIAREIERGGSL